MIVSFVHRRKNIIELESNKFNDLLFDLFDFILYATVNHFSVLSWSCQNVCDALTFFLDNIFIHFGNKLYRQVVGIPMGTNCVTLVADLFLFCYERDFMMFLSVDKQADVIDAFNTTSRYLDDILNINNVYFDNMVSQIYPSELQLNKAIISETEAALLDLHFSISNYMVSTKLMINVTTLILKLSISHF